MLDLKRPIKLLDIEISEVNEIPRLSHARVLLVHPKARVCAALCFELPCLYFNERRENEKLSPNFLFAILAWDLR